MRLSDTVQDEHVKAQIIEDCARLMDEQVAAKNGLSGMALKAAYGVVKGVGPGYIPRAIGRILPDVFEAIEPIWKEGLQTGDPVAYLTQHSSRTADMVLSITDARIERTSAGVVRASYSKFRKSAKVDVESAIPGLAKIIDKHVKVVS